MTRQEIIDKRREQLELACPGIWKNKRVLYIGAHAQQFAFSEQLRANNCEVTVAEISEERCKQIKALGWVHRVVQGDIRRMGEAIEPAYDLVLWSHGPSVITMEEAPRVFSQLYDWAKNLLVIMTPWGKREYTEKRLNKLKQSEYKYDIMGTPYYPTHFRRLGFKVSTIGEKDSPTGNITAWKYVG